MDKISKLFNKIGAKNKKALSETINELLSGAKNLDIKKLQGSEFYRLRKGKFRIIFHYEEKTIIIDSIKMRNDNTYK